MENEENSIMLKGKNVRKSGKDFNPVEMAKSYIEFCSKENRYPREGIKGVKGLVNKDGSPKTPEQEEMSIAVARRNFLSNVVRKKENDGRELTDDEKEALELLNEADEKWPRIKRNINSSSLKNKQLKYMYEKNEIKNEDEIESKKDDYDSFVKNLANIDFAELSIEQIDKLTSKITEYNTTKMRKIASMKVEIGGINTNIEKTDEMIHKKLVEIVKQQVEINKKLDNDIISLDNEINKISLKNKYDNEIEK